MNTPRPYDLHVEKVEIDVSTPMLRELEFGMPFSGILLVEKWGDRWVLVMHSAPAKS